MEANLNQFRLLTVDGEQKANAERRRPVNEDGGDVRRNPSDVAKHRLVYEDCSYFTVSPKNRLRKTASTPTSDPPPPPHHHQPSSPLEPAICNLQHDHNHHHHHHCSSQSQRPHRSLSNRLIPPKFDVFDDDDDDEEDSRDSKPSAPISDDSPEFTPDIHIKRKLSSCQDPFSPEYKTKKSMHTLENLPQLTLGDQEMILETTDPHLKLTKAILTLEKTMSTHCQLLAKRISKDRHNRASCSSTAAAAAESRQHSSHQLLTQIAPKTNLRTEKVAVYMRVIFLKIGEIDTMKENFMADAFIQARWREPALDGLEEQLMETQSIEEIEWERYWNPKLYVENNLGEPKETIWQTVVFGPRGEATVYERRRIKGCFLENLELDDFPFDTQDLTLTITSERADTELDLEEDSTEISSINVQSFVDEQEWALHSHVETWKCITTKIFQNSKLRHPSFSTSCRASRRAGFYIWNIFLVMLFICSLTFATFSVELTKPENRLQLSFILLLTTITFKFVVSQTLPRISYLTYLDKYILTSMGILCSVCVWHAIIPLFKYDIHLAKVVDKWGLIVSATSYFLFHVFFFMYIYIVALKKRWKYDQKDKDHKERVKKLQQLQEQQLQQTRLEMESYQLERQELKQQQQQQQQEIEMANSFALYKQMKESTEEDETGKQRNDDSRQQQLLTLDTIGPADMSTDDRVIKKDGHGMHEVLQIYCRQSTPPPLLPVQLSHQQPTSDASATAAKTKAAKNFNSS